MQIVKDCVFCKVVIGELPCYKIYEDRDFLGILDIFPVRKGHSLIIPKKHYVWTYDVPGFGTYWETTRTVSRAIQKAMRPKWIQYLTHGIIPHAHIHIIPRFEPIEGAEEVPNPSKILHLSKHEFERIAKKIKDTL